MRFLLFGLLVSVGWLQAQSPPNVLIIMADDCTFNDLPAYGGQNAKTPHIDKLAREGLLFRRAYLSEAMCQPCPEWVALTGGALVGKSEKLVG